MIHGITNRETFSRLWELIVKNHQVLNGHNTTNITAGMDAKEIFKLAGQVTRLGNVVTSCLPGSFEKITGAGLWKCVDFRAGVNVIRNTQLRIQFARGIWAL